MTCPQVSELLAPLPSNPSRVSVRVDGRTVARLRVSDAEALGLEVGQPWTEDRRAAAEHAIVKEKARRATLTRLGRRARSTGELRAWLAQTGVPARVGDELIAELVKDGWVNDESYAEDVARSLIARGPVSRELLRAHLARRRVDDATAERVTTTMMAEHEPRRQALHFARRRRHALAAVDSATATRRIANTLSRRGFDADTVRDVLRELDLDHGENPCGSPC